MHRGVYDMKKGTVENLHGVQDIWSQGFVIEETDLHVSK